MAKTVTLTYQSVTRERMTDEFVIGVEDCPAPPLLRARQLFLNGMELWQVSPGRDNRALGYERLDNEILAGVRLGRLVDRGGGTVPYPPQVSRLYGYEADSAEPFALLYPYGGETVEEVGRRLLPDDQARFQVSLLTGLRWLTAAGIAHRGITPTAIRWNRETQQVQITDFSQATVFGVPRTIAGTSHWAGPEQRPVAVGGCVSARDDVWGAGQIICYVLTGEPLTASGQEAGVPDPAGVLVGVFAPPENRPDARELLGRLGAGDPVPRQLTADPLEAGRVRFATIRVGGNGGPSGGDPAPVLATAAGPASATGPARATGSARATTATAAERPLPRRPAHPPRTRTPWQQHPVITVLLSSLLIAVVVVSVIVGVLR
jgi:serine/threonine protein kinase